MLGIKKNLIHGDGNQQEGNSVTSTALLLILTMISDLVGDEKKEINDYFCKRGTGFSSNNARQDRESSKPL